MDFGDLVSQALAGAMAGGSQSKPFGGGTNYNTGVWNPTPSMGGGRLDPSRTAGPDDYLKDFQNGGGPGTMGQWGPGPSMISSGIGQIDRPPPMSQVDKNAPGFNPYMSNTPVQPFQTGMYSPSESAQGALTGYGVGGSGAGDLLRGMGRPPAAPPFSLNNMLAPLIGNTPVPPLPGQTPPPPPMGGFRQPPPPPVNQGMVPLPNMQGPPPQMGRPLSGFRPTSGFRMPEQAPNPITEYLRALFSGGMR